MPQCVTTCLSAFNLFGVAMYWQQVTIFGSNLTKYIKHKKNYKFFSETKVIMLIEDHNQGIYQSRYVR